MKVQTIWVQEHIVFPIIVHSHGYYQMIFCKKAGGSFMIEDALYEAEAGMVYFIQPMQSHAINGSKDMHLVEIKFVIKDEEFARHLAVLPSCFQPQNMSEFKHSIADVLKEGQCQELYCNETTNAAMEIMLVRLLRPYVEPVQEVLDRLGFPVPVSGVVGRQNRIHAQVAQLIHWIELNMTENITLESMCQMARMNKSSLVDCFHSMCGMSPIKYVNWIRLEKAKELLISTNKSITDIAKETGFRRIHYFSRCFKAREGITPVEYRMEYQNSKQRTVTNNR